MKWVERFLVIGVLGLALGLRWHYAHQYPVWLDEANIVVFSHEWSYKTIALLQHWDASHPPLFNLFAKWWLTCFPDESWLRLPSIIWSTLSIAYLYALVKRLTEKIGISLGISLMVAVSGTFIWLSIFFRPYPLVQLAGTGFLYYLVSLIQGRKRNETLLGMSWWATIGVLADYSFWWLVFSLDIVLLIVVLTNWVRRKLIPWRRVGWVVGVTHLAMILWLPVFFRQLPQAFQLNQFRLENLSGNMIVDYGNWLHFLWPSWIGVGVATLIIVTYFIGRRRNLPEERLIASVLLALALMVFGSLFISYWWSPIYVMRNVCVGFYGILLLLALGLKDLSRWIQTGALVLLVGFQFPIQPHIPPVFDKGVAQAKTVIEHLCRTSLPLPIIMDYDFDPYTYDYPRVVLRYYLMRYQSDCPPVYLEAGQFPPRNRWVYIGSKVNLSGRMGQFLDDRCTWEDWGGSLYDVGICQRQSWP